MSERLQPMNPSDKIQRETVSSGSEMAKEKDLLSPEEGGSSKKGRGLLQVPSRSSSQKNQSSPTSTGLSGATVSDPRNSIGGRSKDSKGSFLSRQRNGSASSNRTGGEAEPSNTPANSQPNPPVAPAQKKKKSGGLLAFLGCCVAPNSASPVEADNENENVHKLDKLPPRPVTAKSRTTTPQEQPKPTDEKEPQQSPVTIPESKDKDKRIDSGSASDEIIAAERENRESKQSVPPAVTVEPPQPQSSDEEPRELPKVIDAGDVDMQDVPTEEAEEVLVAPTTEETHMNTIPPPPPPPGPGPSPIASDIIEAGSSQPEPQKWLLPPITAEHKGKKCLVLDLDETLVHSSFKVRLIRTS